MALLTVEKTVDGTVQRRAEGKAGSMALTKESCWAASMEMKSVEMTADQKGRR